MFYLHQPMYKSYSLKPNSRISCVHFITVAIISLKATPGHYKQHH